MLKSTFRISFVLKPRPRISGLNQRRNTALDSLRISGPTIHIAMAPLRIAIESARSFFQFGQHLEAPRRAPVLKYGRGEKGSIRSRFNNLRVNMPLNPKKQIISNSFRFYTAGNPDYSQFLPPLYGFFQASCRIVCRCCGGQRIKNPSIFNKLSCDINRLK